MRDETISRAQLPAIYQARLCRDFDTAELKPVSFLEEKYDRGAYFGKNYYEGRDLVAYALFGKTPGQNYLLLDYLAVEPSFRDQGYGSKVLARIKAETAAFNGIFLEVEAIEKAQDQKEKAIRERRMAFYKKNGLIQTQLFSEINGVTFNILCLPQANQLGDDTVRTELTGIYHTFFDHTAFAQKWRIF